MKKTGNRETEQKSAAMNKILTVVGVILCVILLPVLCINLWLILQNYVSDDIPNAGGYYPLIVQSGSMEPEIMTGDLIINRTAEMDEIEVGDVISYYEGRYIITHRVVEETTDESGKKGFICQGDANNTADETVVTEENLAGIYLRRIPGLGDVAMFMQTTKGLVVCVICPAALLLFYDMIRRRRIEKEEEEETEELRKEIARLREEQRKQSK